MTPVPPPLGSSQHVPSPDDESAGFSVPWSGPNALVGVGAIYALALASSLALLGIVRVFGLSDDLVPAALVVLSPIATLGACVVWLRVRYRGDAWRVKGPHALHTRDLATGLGIGIGCFLGQRVLVVAVSRAAASAGLEIPPIQETFRAIAENPATAPALVLAAVLLAPVAEELLFRGFLFQGLAQRFGFWPGALGSAAVFSLVHLDWGGVVIANAFIIVGILPLGVVFAAVFRARGLLASIGAHATYNAVGVILLIAFRDLVT